MNIAEKIKSYYWIITTIKMCGPITLKDLNDKWIRHNNQWQNLDRNTFRTYRENIEDIFGIKISYTRNGYCLDDPIAIKAHSYQELLTRHVQDIDFYIRFKELGDKLQTDDIPGGADYLNTIGKALTDNLRTLPLHSSQTVIAPYVFQYRVDVTPDLVNEILKMGSNATVIQPESLRQTVKDEIEKMSGNYRNSGKNKSIV